MAKKPRKGMNYRWITVMDIWKGDIIQLWGFEVHTPLWFWEHD